MGERIGPQTIEERRATTRDYANHAVAQFAHPEIAKFWTGAFVGDDPRKNILYKTKKAVLDGISIAFTPESRSELLMQAKKHALAQPLPTDDERRTFAEAAIAELDEWAEAIKPSINNPEKAGVMLRTSIAQALAKLELACTMEDDDINAELEILKIGYAERLSGISELTQVIVLAMRKRKLLEHSNSSDNANPSRLSLTPRPHADLSEEQTLELP